METEIGVHALFFFYTLILLLVCVICSVLSAAAWMSSRQRVFIFSLCAFSCYALETTEIFFCEYLFQNVTFPEAEYYSITLPVMRTAVVTLLQASIWLIALNILDKHSRKLAVIPVVLSFLTSIFVLTCLPVGPWRQWLYYSIRQLFSFFMYGYALYSYATSKNIEYKTRLARLKVPFILIVILSICVLAEDTYVILVAPISVQPEWLLLYLSERNFSENVLMCVYAFFLIKYAYNVLSIRIKEVPVSTSSNDLDRHIDEVMPFFRQKNNLSAREAEILKQVVLGKNNQEIAAEMYLAVGTVKAHVHNILHKTGQSCREALILYFWRSS